MENTHSKLADTERSLACAAREAALPEKGRKGTLNVCEPEGFNLVINVGWEYNLDPTAETVTLEGFSTKGYTG